MSNVIKCRPKTNQVEAMKTHKGQRLGDVYDYISGGKNVYFNITVTRFEVFDEPILFDEFPALTPGDYIVKSSDGYVAFFSPEEFEAKYELEVNPKELHYVITKYGFTVEGAQYMLRDEKVRAILIAPLIKETEAKGKGSRPMNITVNPAVTPTVNAESIVKSISASISNSLTNHSY